MRRSIWIGLAVIVLLAAGWFGYRAYRAGQATATNSPGPAGAQEDAAALENVIWASGKLAPVRWAGLSPAIGGTIKAIHVSEGDQVAAGALLVELEGGILQSQVDVAVATVAEAAAARDKLLAGATDAQLAAARAARAAAQGGLALAQAGVTQAQEAVAAAEAQVAIARAQYNELASHPTAAEKQAAQREVDLAQVAVNHAQAAYDVVRGDPHIAARPEALALEQATAALSAAQAAYNVAVQGATRQQLAAAQAQIDAAEVQVMVARAGIPAAEANVQSAEARVAGAQAPLDGLIAGATAEDKAAAEAAVRSAQAAQAAAQAQLRQTQVIAPFAGQIGSLLARPGELATPGQPLVMLGDTGSMHVETTDLRETDVTRLILGMPVEVSFDALPGQAFQGAIARIAPMSTAEKGSTNYTIDVDVVGLDSSLRWGMTAFVNIRVGK